MSRRLDGGSQGAEAPACAGVGRSPGLRALERVPALPAPEWGLTVDALMRWEWEGGASAAVRDRDQVTPSAGAAATARDEVTARD